MQARGRALVALLGLVVLAACSLAGPPGGLLSRRRRYIVFPKGSSVQFVTDITVGGYVPFTHIFSLSVIYSVAWRLPSTGDALYLQRRSVDQHEHLDLLSDLAHFLNKLGLHGEHCVKRTLCEYDGETHGKGEFIVEMLRTFFKRPAFDNLRKEHIGLCIKISPRHFSFGHPLR